MFVVWGTKIKRKKVGRVADFCPMCRGLSVFELRRVGEASHVYYISFGQGTLLGYDITCETCATPAETVSLTTAITMDSSLSCSSFPICRVIGVLVASEMPSSE